MTLPAGTYMFKLADTPSRNVVQVLSQDEKEILGQWLFVQAERTDVTGETVIIFKETREGTTPAVQYWYYPGEKIGKEFIYPKDQATRSAARTGATVLTEGGPISANSTASSTNAQGQVTEWQREQTTAAAADRRSRRVGRCAGYRAVHCGRQPREPAAPAAARAGGDRRAAEPAPAPLLTSSRAPSARAACRTRGPSRRGARRAAAHGQPARAERPARPALAGRRGRPPRVPRLRRVVSSTHEGSPARGGRPRSCVMEGDR